MPLKNNALPPYCINHPSEVMTPVDPGLDTVGNRLHAIPIVSALDNEYRWVGAATAFSIYAFDVLPRLKPVGARQ